jgi:outer membrane protein OmpA-like peptidoglycan-associated protein
MTTLRVAFLAAASAASFTLSVRADDPARRDFDVDPTKPAVLGDGAWAVETAAPHARGTARAELLVDYSRGLLALRLGNTRLGDAVRDRLALHAIGGLVLGPVELGADIPFVAYQGSDLSPLASRGVSPELLAPIGSTAMGDVRLAGKIPILSRKVLDLAGALEVGLPTGDRNAFTSNGLTAEPRLIAGRRIGPVRLDASVGYLIRKSGQYIQLVARDGLTFGVAGSIPLPRVGALTSWRAIADISGQIPRGLDVDSDRYRAPLSLRGGLRARIWRDLAVDVGAGTGLAGVGDAGYGRESFRVFAGLRWERVVEAGANGAPDRDHDGVPNDRDRCPDTPGPAEFEGCPDRDGDEIPDIDDKCPDQPGPALNDGCPPAPGPLVEIETDRLSLKDAITFDTARDTLKPGSVRIVNEIARLLAAHPELARVRVEGHTDSVGSRAYNVDLSRRRARTVMRALVQRGIPAGRLESEGYGFDRPVASNATALGRAKNRRVEFTVLREGAEGPPPAAPQKP